MTDERTNSNPLEETGWDHIKPEELINLVASKFCRTYSVYPYEKEDLIQFMRLRYFEQFNTARNNYRKEARVKTYVCAVLLNFCREFRRANCSKSIFTESEGIQPEITADGEGELSITKKMVLKYELKRLGYVFKIQGSRKPKVVVALKAYYFIDVTHIDLFKYAQDMDLARYFFDLFSRLNGPRKNAIISYLTKLFNRVEKKNSSEDATRKWVDRHIALVVKLLNTGGERKHDKETLGILMELKFADDK
ncbi:MAG: hypothetical protein JJ975_08850 [Bacteroidia bacterium]|nr:hypothetical protein [Bacteroidia bacterium]